MLRLCSELYLKVYLPGVSPILPRQEVMDGESSNVSSTFPVNSHRPLNAQSRCDLEPSQITPAFGLVQTPWNYFFGEAAGLDAAAGVLAFCVVAVGLAATLAAGEATAPGAAGRK